MHENSEAMFRHHVVPLLRPDSDVLEIGPGELPSVLFRCASHLARTWDTADVATDPRLTYPGVGEYSLPVEDASYDLVVSANVIEHVRMPWRWVRELARVTRPGGQVVVVCPVSWPYHEGPIDCWRIYPEGLRSLYEDAGLETVFAAWGSLESPGRSHYLPGQSEVWQGRRWRLLGRLFGRFGFPVERSYDSVAVGVKPI